MINNLYQKELNPVYPCWLIDISIYGFPTYSCGHNYLLLIDPINSYFTLAHVGVFVPDSVASDNSLSPMKYWPRYLFLDKILKVYTDADIVLEKILEINDRSLSMTCRGWYITQETFANPQSLYGKMGRK